MRFGTTVSPEETPTGSSLEDKGIPGVKWAEQTRHLRILLSVKYALINCPVSASPVVLFLPSSKPPVFVLV